MVTALALTAAAAPDPARDSRVTGQMSCAKRAGGFSCPGSPHEGRCGEVAAVVAAPLSSMASGVYQGWSEELRAAPWQHLFPPLGLSTFEHFCFEPLKLAIGEVARRPL